MAKKGSSDIVGRVAAIFKGHGSEVAETAKKEAIANIQLMRDSSSRFAQVPTPKAFKEQLHAMARAADVFGNTAPSVLSLAKQYAGRRGVTFTSENMRALAKDLRWLADAIRQPKGARRATGEDPRAKALAVLAAANVVRGSVPALFPLQYDPLVREFAPAKFRALAEAMLEGILDSRLDCVGQLDHQIRQYRRDKVDYNQGAGIVITGLKFEKRP